MKATEDTERVQGDEIPLQVGKFQRSSGVWVSTQGYLIGQMFGQQNVHLFLMLCIATVDWTCSRR